MLAFFSCHSVFWTLEVVQWRSLCSQPTALCMYHCSLYDEKSWNSSYSLQLPVSQPERVNASGHTVKNKPRQLIKVQHASWTSIYTKVSKKCYWKYFTFSVKKQMVVRKLENRCNPREEITDQLLILPPASCHADQSLQHLRYSPLERWLFNHVRSLRSE